ncbi:GTPase [Pseudogracilibacillus auburnensis]|uniref:Putative GTPase n=1 Tax=Pseudogracilibacillus auburnensis TaxID=1494959 RepID=A0A2V3W4P3_9BACI|nr:GTPase [Pseudogracilibacillus auburnensis]MBO1001395.1 50S ribosome-binding GTPase [Pseudogracilibacillus auburnensis]PXW83729.1 putative GTPase [Pseudogracilibacillus auburnensis]
MSEKKSNMYKQMEDLFQFILKNVDKSKVSSKNKSQIREEIVGLQSFVIGARPARIAIVGRRGAGKSSLINAIFGEQKAEVGDYKSQTGSGKWYLFENELGGIDILDTRGLGESHNPEEAVLAESPIEEVKQSVKHKCPDVILFLCKGKEVGARIDEDLEQLLQLKKDVLAMHAYDVPIVGIVTQVDELAPASNSEPPFDHPKKQENMTATVHMLEEKMKEIITTPVKVIPISAYVEYEEGEITYDRRWNIDLLLDYLITELPKEAQVIIAKLSKIKSVQKKLARNIGKSVMTVTGLIAATPVPIADMPVITGLQISMIGTIAMISGTKLNRKTIIQFVGAMGMNVGVGVALREVSRQLVKVFPGAGSIISGTIASAGTYALCEAAITYFIDSKTTEEAKEVYEQQFEKQKRKGEEK